MGQTNALVAIVCEERDIPEEGRPLAPQEEEESEESVGAIFWEDELRVERTSTTSCFNRIGQTYAPG